MFPKPELYIMDVAVCSEPLSVDYLQRIQGSVLSRRSFSLTRHTNSVPGHTGLESEQYEPNTAWIV